MTSWRDAVTAKVGPLPAWVWGVGLGVAVVGWQAWRRRNAPPPATEDETGAATDGTEGATAAGEYADLGLLPSPIGGIGFVPAPTTPPASSTPDQGDPDSNGEWMDRAFSYLTDERGFTPSLVQNALVKFLDGNAVTSAEESVINAALQRFGRPPEGAPSIILVPAPPVTPPATPAVSPPSAVTNVRSGQARPGAIQIGWDPPASNGGAPVLGYVVQAERPEFPGRWISQQASGTGTAFPVEDNAQYRFRVAARNSRGLGPYVTTGLIATYRTPKPPAPTPPTAPKPPTTPPATPKPPAPARSTPRTVGAGDVLWNMVNREYGRVTARAVEQVARYNGLTTAGSGSSLQVRPWAVGQRVWFPPEASINF